MPLRPDRRLQFRIGCALALVVGVNAVALSVLVWSVHRGLSASDHSAGLDLGLPVTVGTVLVGAIGLVAVQARHGSRTAVAGLETETIEGDGPRNVGPRVRRLAAQANVPTPTVAVADQPDPNCLTVGTRRSPTVVVTTGLLEELNDDELEAALAHEVAHLANRDLTVVSAVAAIVAIGDSLLERERTFSGVAASIVAVVVTTFSMLWLVPYVALAGALLLLLLAAPFFALTALVLVVSAVARLLLGVNAITLGLFAKTREYAADRGAVQLTGDPAALVSALETLEGDDRPDRDVRARLDASATLGIVPQSLAERSDDDEGEDGGEDDDAEGWFDRWFASQFETWRKKVPEQSLNERYDDAESETHQWRDDEKRQWQLQESENGDGDAADEPTSWIVEPIQETVIAPIRSRVRRVLRWRPATHPSSEARIERLRLLERRRR
ncbi:M48 family metalloprotease [Natronolimnohabitans sp. A-GB9]|uniref:M48 family metallopeptidase n=1 Tax=Natronolimnohabitans sp. A-GB9 TaxID=3069757 RepID=UPI0027B5793B|nr:M48 family metalloprotease [Natronolimnohabitans sp. A-GB9]MDQ2052023.1 M48 family metalloprotease [Natronolimnohabitans sp. A-GB9]